jgi:hypothetical protein
MRSKRPKQISELNRARLLEQSRAYCRTLNELTASVSPVSEDYLAVSNLNAAVLETIRAVTGDMAPWVRPVTGASYPDDSKG